MAGSKKGRLVPDLDKVLNLDDIRILDEVSEHFSSHNVYTHLLLDLFRLLTHVLFEMVVTI